MKNIKHAFTFVELIVVITIIAILSTIGFTVYQKYLASSRDTNRFVQLAEITDWFKRLSLNARLPFPEDMVSIEVGSWATIKNFAYQWFAGETVMKTIGYTSGWKDPEYGIYPTYMLSENRKNFQILTYIQDAKLLSSVSAETFADTIDFQKLFPKVAGDMLWIMIEQETQIPLQLISSIQSVGKYNITTGTWLLNAYFEDTNIVSSTQSWFINILPNQNCKRIKELWHSQGDGDYIINPSGVSAFSVYCDMKTDGGGWTLVARSVLGAATGSGFWWLIERGNPSIDSSPYSMWSRVKTIDFSSIMFTWYSYAKAPSGVAWKLNNIDRSILLTDATWAILNSDCSTHISTLSGSVWICDVAGPNWNVWGRITDTTKYFISWKDTKTWLWLSRDKYYLENAATDTPALPGMIFIR